MNYFKLLVALLGSAPFASGAANPRAASDGVCHFNAADSEELVQIVRKGDDPAPLAEMLEGCQGVEHSHNLDAGLRDMIRMRRHVLFHFLLPRIECRGAFTRDLMLYWLLSLALGYSNFAIAGEMLAQGALNHRRAEMPLWIGAGQTVWKLEELQAFVDGHREQAAALSPTHGDMHRVRSEADVRVLVALAQHCQAISGEQDTFGPTQMLRALLVDTGIITEEALARVALLLFKKGAELNDSILELFRAKHPEAYRLFHELLQKDVQ